MWELFLTLFFMFYVGMALYAALVVSIMIENEDRRSTLSDAYMVIFWPLMTFTVTVLDIMRGRRPSWSIWLPTVVFYVGAFFVGWYIGMKTA